MKTRFLVMLLLSALLMGAHDVWPQHSASVAITMTVAPLYGVVLELYDRDGSLVARSDPAIPPATVTVHSPDGNRAGIRLPGVRLAAQDTIRAFIEGTEPMRQGIENADAKARARGVSPIRRLCAMEFRGPEDLGLRPGICLCFPEDLDETVVDNLAMFRLDETSEEWVRLPACRTDPVECMISADDAGFGVFRAMARTATDLRRLVVLPNPYLPRTAAGGCVKFINLTADATIRIYDIQGRLVWETDLTDGGGSAFWYGDDTAGRPQASGIYPYVITTPQDNQISGKITLIR
jgi:hypothetical protein